MGLMFIYGLDGFVVAHDEESGQSKGEMGRHTEGDMRFPDPSLVRGRGLVARGSRVAWPNGLVPYEFSPGYTIEQQNIIVSAMRRLENSVAMNGSTCVRFRPREMADQYYIVISNGDGCWSYVGMNAGISMTRTVSLESPRCLRDGTIMHELLHTLGFYHEQSRPDRDNFVRVNYANIQSGMTNNFEKYDNRTTETYNFPYDYSSVMHYGPLAFSSNGQPTIVPLQANVSIGQRNNLSSSDIRVVRTLYNCTSTGPTLPTPIVTTTANIYASNGSISVTLSSTSPRFLRSGATSGTFYYQAFRVIPSSSGLYRFASSGSLNTFGYLYGNRFFPESPETNILGSDDNTGGSNQFQMTLFLNTTITYILVVTTSVAEITGTINVLASGLSRVTVTSLNDTSTSSASTTRTTATPTTTPIPGIASNYSSALTVNSSRFTRHGGLGLFYYEALQLNTSQNGSYTIRSSSTVNDFGYLYMNSFDPLSPATNLLVSDDDSAGSSNFQLNSVLQVGRTYVLVYTTFGPNVTGPFVLIARGPATVTFRRINLQPITTASATMPSTTTRTTGGCNQMSSNPACPVAVATSGRVFSIDRNGWSVNGIHFASNNTYFNLNDSISVSGYLQNVTIQYAQGRLPTVSARIWIYIIVPIMGGFVGCNRYAVPSSQISTSLAVQTYTVLNNSLSVTNGTYIGIGIQDTTAAFAATWNNTGLSIGNGNLTLNSTVYARLDSSRSGIKLGYTVMT